jgi:hypothetical protein
MRRRHPAFAFDQFAPDHGDLGNWPTKRKETETEEPGEERGGPYLRRSNVIAGAIDHVWTKNYALTVRNGSFLPVGFKPTS